MKKVLHILRISVHAIFAVMFVVVLVLAIGVFTFSNSFDDRTTVKSWIDDADIYKKITPASLSLFTDELSQKSFQETLEQSDNIDATAIEKVIDEVYSPSYYASSVNTIIDKTFDRVENQHIRPSDFSFEIKASDRAEQLEVELVRVFSHQLNKLDNCTQKQLEALPDVFDPYTISCVPSEGFDLRDEVDKYVNQITGPDSFLEGVVISDKTIFEGTPVLQTYNRLETFRSVLPVVLVASIIGFIITSKTPFKSVSNLGYISIVTGVVMNIVFLFVKQLGRFEVTVNNGDSATYQFSSEVISPIIQSAIINLSDVGVRTSLVAVVLGVILVLLYYPYKKLHSLGKEKRTEMYKKLTGSGAGHMTMADIATMGNKSKQSKEDLIESVKEQKALKDLAQDETHTVDEIAKRAKYPTKTEKKKPQKKKPAKPQQQAKTKNPSQKKKITVR